MQKPPAKRRDHRGAYGGQPGLYPFSEMADDDHRLIRAAYWAMCDLIDVQVGRLMEALGRTGALAKTLVIFMSDHGELLGDHGIYLKGPFFYEPAVRVPLIISCPGLVAGGRSTPSLVELVDLAPTLLEAAGQPPHPGMQGRSLWPLLTGRAAAERHREDVYCEHYGTTHRAPGQGRAYATMLRTDRHKLVAWHGEPSGELYDLRRDPTETHNLSDDPSANGVKLRLFQRLCDRMAWTVDPLPEREASY